MKITQNAYFPNGFSEFLHFNQNISEQKISLILQHIVKHIPQILEEALTLFLVLTMQRSETKAFCLSLK